MTTEARSGDESPGAESAHTDPSSGGSTENDPINGESPTGLLVAVLWDGVVGAVAGLAGNVVVVGTLAVTALLGGFGFEQFSFTAEMLMLQLILTQQQLVWVGFALFVGGGLTVWPLLLATLGMFLPGDGYDKKGLFFGAIMWTGFAFAFYGGYGGIEFVLYLLGSFIGHVGYGFVTGTAMDRLFAEEGRPVIVGSLAAPSAGTEPSANPSAESVGVGGVDSWDQRPETESSETDPDPERVAEEDD